MIAKLPPAVIALLLQLAAFFFAVLSVRVAGETLHPLVFALICGVFATAFSRLAGLARWWLLIQFSFAPALVLMLTLDIPSGFYLAVFLILLAVYWSTFRTQVPLYLSSNKVWCALEDLLPKKQGFRFADLGSGLGGVLTHLAGVRPDGRYFGVESAPLPLLWSWLRVKLGAHQQCAVRWGSLWDCDLAGYDVVFAYLSPVPMERLWNKARAEMRPGSLFISSTFAVPEQKPHKTIQVEDLHRTTLLVWRM
ncbi:MAG: class I SAM-dependent methyltransferase [Gallionella sp.]|nr:class I SAM-dependent methyltransferase [Gallionella sp.]